MAEATSGSKYDTIIIGTGQGGVPLARALAGAGRSVAIIERGPVGGTCINFGCTPTKTMVASARVAYLARRGNDFGVELGSLAIDQVRIRRRKRDIVVEFETSSEQSLEGDRNLDLIRGEASFAGERLVVVSLPDSDPIQLTAPTIVIDAGCSPAVPRIPGIEEVGYLDSTSIMELDETPRHLIVLGGGYVGLEFAQMFRRFGSEVTVVQRARQLLGREDPDVAEAVLGILESDGIKVHLNANAQSVSSAQAGQIRVEVSLGGQEIEVTGTHLLAAAGRSPNSSALNLSHAGIDVDVGGFIKVDDALRTSAPGVFAIGDIKGGPAFTHISYDDYRVLKRRLLDGEDATIVGRMVPYTVFIDPQLGRVGMTEHEAKAAGLEYVVAKMEMSHVARALEMGESRGFMKALVEQSTKQILGVAILGVEGGELMAMLQLAMMGKLPCTVLRDAIFAHPTLAESFNNLFAGIE